MIKISIEEKERIAHATTKALRDMIIRKSSGNLHIIHKKPQQNKKVIININGKKKCISCNVLKNTFEFSTRRGIKGDIQYRGKCKICSNRRSRKLKKIRRENERRLRH